jgi:hypothetical protein
MIRPMPRFASRKLAANIRAHLERANRRKPRGGMPAMAEPPRGPLPLQGGAEAPLKFES